MEIKRSEVIASVVIVACMLIIGFIISGTIQQRMLESYQIYDTASKIDDKELFEYAMKTNVGHAFVYGKLKTLDPVSYPEIEGQYSSIIVKKQRYTMHSRTVTRTYVDSNGKTRTKTEIEHYWTWDTFGVEEKRATRISFLGVEFDYNKIPYSNDVMIKTLSTGFHTRNVYYGTETDFQGTIFAMLQDGTIDDTRFYKNMTIKETIKTLETGSEIIGFWIGWIILTIAVVFGFYYLDNNWLD